MSWFDKQQPAFIATGTFGPRDAQKWTSYIAWSGLTQLTELVSLGGMLCAPVLSKVKDSYWPRIVNEDYILYYFTGLEFFASGDCRHS